MTEILLTLFLKRNMTLTYDHNSAKAFAGTFAFLPTLEPIQKKQKSLQATAQGQSKLDTADLRPKRATSANRRLAQWRVTWLIEHSTSHQFLLCIDSFVLRNPPLRQAPKRQAVKKPHFDFFSTSQEVYKWILS